MVRGTPKQTPSGGRAAPEKTGSVVSSMLNSLRSIVTLKPRETRVDPEVADFFQDEVMQGHYERPNRAFRPRLTAADDEHDRRGSGSVQRPAPEDVPTLAPESSSSDILDVAQRSRAAARSRQAPEQRARRRSSDHMTPAAQPSAQRPTAGDVYATPPAGVLPASQYGPTPYFMVVSPPGAAGQPASRESPVAQPFAQPFAAYMAGDGSSFQAPPRSGSTLPPQAYVPAPAILIPSPVMAPPPAAQRPPEPQKAEFVVIPASLMRVYKRLTSEDAPAEAPGVSHKVFKGAKGPAAGTDASVLTRAVRMELARLVSGAAAKYTIVPNTEGAAQPVASGAGAARRRSSTAASASTDRPDEHASGHASGHAGERAAAPKRSTFKPRAKSGGPDAATPSSQSSEGSDGGDGSDRALTQSYMDKVSRNTEQNRSVAAAEITRGMLGAPAPDARRGSGTQCGSGAGATDFTLSVSSDREEGQAPVHPRAVHGNRARPSKVTESSYTERAQMSGAVASKPSEESVSARDMVPNPLHRTAPAVSTDSKPSRKVAESRSRDGSRVHTDSEDNVQPAPRDMGLAGSRAPRAEFAFAALNPDNSAKGAVPRVEVKKEPSPEMARPVAAAAAATQPEAKVAAPMFSFGHAKSQPAAQLVVPPTVSLTAQPPAQQAAPPVAPPPPQAPGATQGFKFTFGSTNPPGQPATAFGAPQEAPKPAFGLFGNTAAAADAAPKPMFSFGKQTPAAEQKPAPTFTFGAPPIQAPISTPVPALAPAMAQTQEPSSSAGFSFSFGQPAQQTTQPVQEATPGPSQAPRPAFTFGGGDKPAFTFGATQPPQPQQSGTFGTFGSMPSGQNPLQQPGGAAPASNTFSFSFSNAQASSAQTALANVGSGFETHKRTSGNPPLK